MAGAGCGLNGLALAKLGCPTIITDLEEVLPVMQRSIDLNPGLQCVARAHSYGDVTADRLGGPSTGRSEADE